MRDTPSNIDLLDDFYEEVSTLTEPMTGSRVSRKATVTPVQRDEPSGPVLGDADATREHRQQRCVLNKRIYLIWKFPEYCTAYVTDDIFDSANSSQMTPRRG